MNHFPRFDIWDTGCADETPKQEERREALESAKREMKKAWTAWRGVSEAMADLENELGDWDRLIDEGEPPEGAASMLWHRAKDMEAARTNLLCLRDMLGMLR